MALWVLTVLAAVGWSAAQVPCIDGSSKACAVSAALAVGEEGSLALLQQGAKSARSVKKARAVREAGRRTGKTIHRDACQASNGTCQAAVWDQLVGAVQIQQLEAAIQNASDAATVENLRAQLNNLQLVNDHI